MPRIYTSTNDPLDEDHHLSEESLELTDDDGNRRE
jgi:hypothetical protein